MTAVQTTPPPRLPVRTKAAAQDRGWGGVSPMLTRLAAERATGILVRERGTLHLAEGRVVHAESPYAPPLDVLLTARGTLDPGIWRRALAEAGDRHRAGHLLVDGGYLAPGALEMCRLVALYDAAYFALAPSGSPGRFRYSGGDGAAGGDGGGGTDRGAEDPAPGGGTGPGTGKALDCTCPVAVADLERETLRRRDLLHRIWPDATADEAPLTRAPRAAPPPSSARQRAVLARLDDSRTAVDIARDLGRPAFHTLVDVRRLAAAGILSAHRRPPAAGTAVPPPSLAPPSLAPPAPRPAAPLRTGPPLPSAYPTSSAPAPAPPSAPVPDTADPHITLLRRLRDALEAL
jgi:hypothetical protein